MGGKEGLGGAGWMPPADLEEKRGEEEVTGTDRNLMQSFRM